MNFLQNLWSDLVDKRLLPVVAILIAALIAVPVVLGRAKDPETPAPAEQIASTDDVTSPGKVTLDPDGASPEFIQREAKRRDPFAREKVKKKAQTATDAAASVGKALGGGDSGTSTTSKSTGGTQTTAAKPKPATKRVTLEFGQTGSVKRYSNITKLTPLPSEDNPLFVYQGVNTDGDAAVFLISTEAVPSGDGKCEPAGNDCQKLTIKKDQVEYFDVPSGTGGITQYELKILSIG
ncbi:MAG: hypothetical protein V9E83_06540 [Baekduia sp.]